MPTTPSKHVSGDLARIDRRIFLDRTRQRGLPHRLLDLFINVTIVVITLGTVVLLTDAVVRFFVGGV